MDLAQKFKVERQKILVNSDFGSELFPNLPMGLLWSDKQNEEICEEEASTKGKEAQELNTTCDEQSEVLETSKFVMFVGDYLRDKSDRAGVFSERQEELLHKIASAMKLNKEEYSISCIAPISVKSPAEAKHILMENKAEFDKKVWERRPEFVIALGALATEVLLGQKERLSSVHGKFFARTFSSNDTELKTLVVPIFHPDLLIINPSMKKTAWIDLQKIMAHRAQSSL